MQTLDLRCSSQVRQLIMISQPWQALVDSIVPSLGFVLDSDYKDTNPDRAACLLGNFGQANFSESISSSIRWVL